MNQPWLAAVASGRVNDLRVPPSGQFLLNATIFVAALLIGLAAWRRRWTDLSNCRRDVSAMTPAQWFMLTIAGYLLPPILLVLAIPALRERLGEDEKSIEFLGTVTPILHITSIAIMATLLLVSRATTLTHERARAARGLAEGALAAMLIASPLLAVGMASVYVKTLVSGAAPDPVAHEVLELLRDHRGDSWGWILMLSAAVGAPIAEELLWRGGVQSTVLRITGELGPARPWVAIAATSVLFALVHVSVAPVHALPTLFALSLALGLVRERTGSLLAPIVLHALFNIANLAAVLL